MTGTEPVLIVPYDNLWPIQFDLERRWILGKIPLSHVDIQHIGSTAITGMIGVPCIDMLLGMTSTGDSVRIVHILTEFGYVPDGGEVDAICLRRPGYRGVVTDVGSSVWSQCLRVRECLLTDPGIAEEYAGLKRGVAPQDVGDFDVYTRLKTAFLRSL